MKAHLRENLQQKPQTPVQWHLLTGVFASEDTDPEADCRYTCTMKGVKDWITASHTALAISWTMVELGLTLDGDFKMGGDDVVAVGVKLDVDVEGKESCAHTPDVGSQRAPTYVLSFWDIKDEALSDAKAK